MPDHAIAIIGMGCRYPDARSPAELWENALAQRRAFRRMPAERLRIEDYHADAGLSDSVTTTQAAVIEGYEFDRVRFRTAGATYREVDLAHWLALDVADQALADAGFADGHGLPRAMTGVLVGNTLTGEFSRANTLRLRWPYVRRVVDAALAESDWAPERRQAFLASLETRYKAPFPAVGGESLAGGLSNTIAGRICNHFDLNGGGYTVDGACASSLLAVTTACSALAAGDLDLALAGGVDLSLDPFELVGFSRVGVLAREDMRVYDARATGFWPGEGCGFVVLMRADQARAEGRRIHGVIRGWGVASDGSGGMTRPEASGQLLALERAYRRAGFGAETIGYFEGHGTGTEVGDLTELDVILRARGTGTAPAAALGSIKANMGHTKAAAGVAGLIKATMSVRAQVLPPLAGQRDPHPRLVRDRADLRTPRSGELWPSGMPLRAAVSAMGFGGIDTHVVIESATPERRTALTDDERALISSPQDAELFLLEGADTQALRDQIARLRALAGRLSLAEMADVACTLQNSLAAKATAGADARRAAVVASTPGELDERLGVLDAWLAEGVEVRLDVARGISLGALGGTSPRIGFLFTGQGAPSNVAGGLWARRFESLRPLYDAVATRVAAEAATTTDTTATQIAQPAIVTNSLAALRLLDELGVCAEVAVGHSLGEITACHWASVFDADALVRIAAARGRAMADLAASNGTMASLAATAEEVGTLIAGHAVVIAGLNGPRRTVIAGEANAVTAVVEIARARSIPATALAVSHAFHSPLVAAAEPALRAQLDRERFEPVERRVLSTVSGTPLGRDDDVRELLCRQVTHPVRFVEAVSHARNVDLWIEVGPGHVLSGLVADLGPAPAIALDAGSESIAGLLRATGAVWALGGAVDPQPLFAGRFARAFDLDRPLSFFANPCEQAPLPSDAGTHAVAAHTTSGATATVDRDHEPAATNGAAHGNGAESADDPAAVLEVVRRLVAEQVELPVSAVGDDDRLLGDLHLNSITVGQLAVDGARRLGLPAPADPASYAGATVAELAIALAELRTGGAPKAPRRIAEGVGPWVRPFVVREVERPRPSRPKPAGPAEWRVLADAQHPIAADLERALHAEGTGRGVVVCLAAEPDARDIARLLEGARLAMADRGARFVVVQQGGGGGAFARSLHLESRDTTTCVVDVPYDHKDAVAWIVAEANAALGYHEARYDRDGRRHEPVMTPLTETAAVHAPPLAKDDVMLVTGGGKGIAAECALALAREYGVKLGLIGRSDAGSDPALAANLARFAAAGVTTYYAAADVTDAEAVRDAVRSIEQRLGPVVAVLHGAGINEPRPLSALTEAIVERTLRTKLDGARNVLAAIDPGTLKLFVTFGSIIARTGLRGEADYGLANEWLTRFVERFQTEHAACRCLSVEWSVWSGTGMGERLGRLDALMREGITPIAPEAGIGMLSRLLRAPLPGSSVIVAGRIGELPTLALEQPPMPLRRFIERIAVHYPGIELVVDTDLSPESDPYLRDHVYRGVMLLPAVMGLEAIAQVAMTLAGESNAPVFERVAFHRPITVPAGGECTLRVAALMREDGSVDVVLRSSESDFAVDHFEARCVFGARPAGLEHLADRDDLNGPLPLDPERDLYGGMLFQSGRFQRVLNYRVLRATECVVEIATDTRPEWFGPYVPADLVLGDPGARDAAIHGIQACIPHMTVLPTAVARIVPGDLGAGAPWTVHARERSRLGDRFVYDLEIADAGGRVRERWEGLELKAMPGVARAGAWPLPLLGPYVERRVAELIPGSAVRVALAANGHATRGGNSEHAMSLAFGRAIAVHRDPNGKPSLPSEPAQSVSSSHAGTLTFAIGGCGPIGCDVAGVIARTELQWRDLLGPRRFGLAERMASESAGELGPAATRVWAAHECLRKAGWAGDQPLVLVETGADGWTVLASGPLRVATYLASIQDATEPTVMAVLARRDDGGL